MGKRIIVKESVSLLFFLIAGFFVLGLSGCEKEEKVDLTDWSLPSLEEKERVTEEAVEVEEEASPAAKEPQPVIHIVQKDDIIYDIAEKYGVPPERLAEVNGLGLSRRKSVIYPGQKLIIPAK